MSFEHDDSEEETTRPTRTTGTSDAQVDAAELVSIAALERNIDDRPEQTVRGQEAVEPQADEVEAKQTKELIDQVVGQVVDQAPVQPTHLLSSEWIQERSSMVTVPLHRYEGRFDRDGNVIWQNTVEKNGDVVDGVENSVFFNDVPKLENDNKGPESNNHESYIDVRLYSRDDGKINFSACTEGNIPPTSVKMEIELNDEELGGSEKLQVIHLDVPSMRVSLGNGQPLTEEERDKIIHFDRVITHDGRSEQWGNTISLDDFLVARHNYFITENSHSFTAKNGGQSQRG